MEYTVVRKTEWDKVPMAEISNVCWGYDQPDVKAWAQVCYDDEYLYVKLTATEKEIRVKECGPLGMPCEDSCLEFFISPVCDGRYFNIEFNPGCCNFLGFGKDIDHLSRLVQEDTTKNILCPASELTDDGWYITYSIPFEFINRFFPEFKAEPGKKMRGNFYKCGNLLSFAIVCTKKDCVILKNA